MGVSRDLVSRWWYILLHRSFWWALVGVNMSREKGRGKREDGREGVDRGGVRERGKKGASGSCTSNCHMHVT